MVFSSHLFLFGFLPLALAAYFLAPRRARNLVVTITSCVFYGWWNPIYLLLLLATTVIDYWAGLVQATERWWPFGVEPRPLELGWSAQPDPAHGAPRLHRLEPRPARLLQVLELRRLELEHGRRRGRPQHAPASTA